MQPICGGGFCWENPLPIGVDLWSAETSPSGSNWVVGEDGTILKWDGNTWSGWYATTNTRLNAVWPFSDTDVWAVGVNGTILHFDGASWTPVPSSTTQTLVGLWGAPDGTLWAVGASGTVLKRSPGGSFVAQAVPTTATLNSVFGIGNDLWCVGDRIILGFNGTAWTTTNTWMVLTDIWGASATDLWAVSSSGVMRFTGTSWTTSSAASGNAITGRSSTDVWVGSQSDGVYRFNGLGWTWSSADPAGTAIYGLTANAADNTVLAVGEGGALYRHNGQTWNRLNKGVSAVNWERSLTTLDVYARDTEVFMVGYSSPSSSSPNRGTLIRCTSSGCTLSYNGYYEAVSRVFGVGSEVWASDVSRVYRYSTGWTPLPALPSYPDIYAMAPISATDLWVVGGDKTLRFDGAAWTSVSNPVSTTTTYLRAAAAGAANLVWAGGDSGTLLKFDGTSWSAVSSGVTSTIMSMYARGPNEAYAIGAFGVIRYDGISWSPTAQTTTVDDLWPESSTAYWIVEGGKAKRWSGGTLQDMTPWTNGLGLGVKAVTGSGSNVWIMGPSVELLRKQ